MAFKLLNFTNVLVLLLCNTSTFVFAQAKIEFLNSEVNVGEIYEGELPLVKYVYKNTGDKPLQIKTMKSTCGCYSPSWKSDSTLPGKMDTIKAYYNSVSHAGGISKSIFVVSNGSTQENELMIRGRVKTFSPDLQFYYGGNGSDIQFTVKENKGQKNILLTLDKNKTYSNPVTLVLNSKAAETKQATILENEQSKKHISFKVLKNELANSKLTYVSPDNFFISKTDSEIIYLTLLDKTSSEFDVRIGKEVVRVQIIFR